MKRMFIRLDDACPKRDIEKWDRIEALLDKNNIKPLVGIIPDCKDPDMDHYEMDESFWSVCVHRWKEKGWILALHGLNHVFNTEDGGVNPVNKRSEYAGLPLDEQKEKIRKGVEILRNYSIEAEVFFAPAHTFDKNTLLALKEESQIRFVSDTPTYDCYYDDGFTFIPQQSGSIRWLPFKTITYCLHPNNMQEKEFEILEANLKKYHINDFLLEKTDRKVNIIDNVLMLLYYAKHRG